jgi:DNA-binding NarL/FixJ family response regulator
MTVRVLLVDAHEEARQSLVRRLESDGRVAVSAQVSTVAEAEVAVRGSQCDLALMNVQSHDNESISRCQELRRLTGIPLIVLASFMTSEDWRALSQAGAADYLLKNANSQRLCTAIVRLADRHGTATAAAREVGNEQ